MALIFESKRDDFLNQYVDLLASKGIETNLGQLKGFLLKKFASEFGMHNLSKESNYYLAGVTRYYFEGLLTSNKRLNVFYPKFRDRPIAEVCERLDALVEILRNAYIDTVGTQFEQPEDFGSLPLDKLLKKYNKKINVALGLDGKNAIKEPEPEVDDSVKAGRNYTYEIIYDYEQLKKYEQYTRPGAWCITYGKQHYNGYIRLLKGIHYIVFKRNGFEKVPRKVGKGFTKRKPHDAYGNSLICVLQKNSSPEPTYITSRWNHGAREDGTIGIEADHAYTKEEFLAVIGDDGSVLQRCYDQWKKNVPTTVEQSVSRSEIIRKFKYAQMKMNNGANPFKMEIFDVISGYYDTEARFQSANKSFYVAGFKSKGDGINTEYYYTVVQKGMVLYDKVLLKSDSGPKTKMLTNDLFILNDNQVYSRKRMSLLDADGITKFRKDDILHSYNPAEYRYHLFAASGNQIALLDLERGDFMADPNGHKIFECIRHFRRSYYRSRASSEWRNTDYNGHIKLDNIRVESGGYIVFVYDSSSFESYVYDVETSSFSPLKADIMGEDGVWLRLSPYGTDVPGLVAYECIDGDNAGKCERFYDIKSGELFRIGEYYDFNLHTLELVGDDLVYAFQPYGVKMSSEDCPYGQGRFLYDRGIGKIVLDDETGRPIAGRLDAFADQVDWIRIGEYHDSKLYNPYTHTFYRDESGNERFHANVTQDGLGCDPKTLGYKSYYAVVIIDNNKQDEFYKDKNWLFYPKYKKKDHYTVLPSAKNYAMSMSVAENVVHPRTVIITEDQVNRILRKMVLNESTRDGVFRKRTWHVLKDFFSDNSFIDSPYSVPANKDNLPAYQWLEKMFKDEFFHGHVPETVLRLEPIIMNIALHLGWFLEEGYKDYNANKLKRLKAIVNYISMDVARYKNKGMNPPYSLNYLTMDNCSFDLLNNYFGSKLDEERNADNERARSGGFEGRNPNYIILRDIDFDTANEYGKHSNSHGELCYCMSYHDWLNFTNKGHNTVYLILHKDWEEIEEITREACPFDEYGLSMIFLFIDEDGDIAYSNTRWNHDTDGHDERLPSADHAFTKEYISRLLGVDFDSEFPPVEHNQDPWEIVERLMDNGDSIIDIVDGYRKAFDTYYIVELDGKENVIYDTYTVLSEIWFDQIYDYDDNVEIFIVELDGKYNFMNNKGDLMYKYGDDEDPSTWFDDIIRQDYGEGIYLVLKEDRWNVFFSNGALLFEGFPEEWPKHISDAIYWAGKNEVVFIVMNKDKLAIFDSERNQITDWYDDVSLDSNDYYALVQNKGKFNMIGPDEELVSKNMWYDDMDGYFMYNYCVVMNGNKYNFIDKQGNLLTPNQWYDMANSFTSYGDGRLLAKVELNDRMMYIDTQGNFHTQQTS